MLRLSWICYRIKTAIFGLALGMAVEFGDLTLQLLTEQVLIPLPIIRRLLIITC